MNFYFLYICQISVKKICQWTKFRVAAVLSYTYVVHLFCEARKRGATHIQMQHHVCSDGGSG